MEDILKLRGVLSLVLTLGLVSSGVNAHGNCEIEIDPADRGFRLPLLVRPDTEKVLYPELRNGEIIISIPQGTDIIAACLGINNGLKSLNKQTTVDLTCNNVGQLSLKLNPQVVITWGHLGCLRRLRGDVRKLHSPCGQGGQIYDIGWPIRNKLFVPLIRICFDEDKETTQTAFHELNGRIIGVKMVDSTQRPQFLSARMFSVSVQQDYKKTNEVGLFTKLLGTSEHLTGEGEHYLARGHLAPDSDFFYSGEQNATYFYGNVIPQWQSFNNGNWKRMESAVRNLAEKHQTTFYIWTGTYSTLRLPDVNDNAVSMFLGLREQKEKIPVPALLWKVIYNPNNQEGVAIVSVNDVKGKGSSADVNLQNPPCQDVCDQLSWISPTWNTKDIWRGRTFCCDFNDLKLKGTIPTLPDIHGRVDLLKN